MFTATCRDTRECRCSTNNYTHAACSGGFAAGPPAEPATPPGVPAAVGLGDSWHRGADNPRDVVFWGIRTAIKFRPSHMAVDLANRLIKELQLKPDHMTELSLASRDRAERPHRDRLASSRCVGFSRASAVVVHVLGDSIVTRTQIDSLLG